MISDGIENVYNIWIILALNEVIALFAYFTQIIYYAFIEEYRKKKQIQIKSKLIQNTGVENMMG